MNQFQLAQTVDKNQLTKCLYGATIAEILIVVLAQLRSNFMVLDVVMYLGLFIK